eukprot:GHVT01019012.1.p1 GENE.GHVT01019012.1~~GHVT01019012.1.p1  ORF type:complete len:361 (+),score=56.04 GHVT01019012.1:129-1211(+)
MMAPSPTSDLPCSPCPPSSSSSSSPFASQPSAVLDEFARTPSSGSTSSSSSSSATDELPLLTQGLGRGTPASAVAHLRRIYSLPIRLLCTVYFFFAVVFGFSAALVTQLSIYVVLAPLMIASPTIREKLLGLALRFWMNCAVFWLNPFFSRKTIQPPPKGYKPGKTILIVNHLSALDPWVACCSCWPWEFKFVFKSSLLRLPLANWSVMLAGDIPLYFTSEKGGWGTKPGAVVTMMERVKYLCELGIGTTIFPEGTRSMEGRLQPFKDGFFRFAVENNVEILPCALHNSQTLWPLRSWLFNPGTCYFAFGNAIKPDGLTMEELRDKTRASVYELIKLFPDYEEEKERPLNDFSVSRGLGI